MAITEMTAVGVIFRCATRSGADSPDVWAESGGVSPGSTLPPGVSPGVVAGLGSGGGVVILSAYPELWPRNVAEPRGFRRFSAYDGGDKGSGKFLLSNSSVAAVPSQSSLVLRMIGLNGSREFVQQA
jgi:hypothetical protein